METKIRMTPLRVPNMAPAGDRTVMEADEQDAALAMAALAISGRPRFTEADEELERATMTNEEKVEALCDLFGKCSVRVLIKTNEPGTTLTESPSTFLSDK